MSILQKRRLLSYSIAVALMVYAFSNRRILFSLGTVMLYAFAQTLLLAPISKRIEERGISSGISALLCIIGLFLMLTFMLSCVIPYLITNIPMLFQRSIPVVSDIFKYVQHILQRFNLEQGYQNYISKYAGWIISGITAYFAQFGISFVSQVSRFVFSLVITFHLLCEKEKLTRHLLLCIPIKYRIAYLKMMRAVKQAVLGYLSGLIKTSLFVALGTYIGLLLLRIPDALLLSVIMGIMELFPYIGPVLGSVPILLSAVPMGMKTLLFVALLIILVQQIEGNVIGPYFTASSTSIHPLTALLSVFFFGSLIGIWGIILAVPIIVTAKSIIWSFRQERIL